MTTTYRAVCGNRISMIEMMPELETERLKLIPYVAGFVTDEHVAWLNDKDVTRYSEQRHLQHSLESEHKYLNSRNENESIWLLRTKEDAPRDIGTIAATIDNHNRVADMAIMVGNKDVSNKGYATEAWKAVMNWLFNVRHMRKIECGTMADNIPMRMLAVRCGMKCEAVKIQHFLHNGIPMALAYYAKFKPEPRPPSKKKKKMIEADKAKKESK